MELILQREIATVKSTPGTLTGITGLTLFTLEPPPTPDPNETGCPISIPAGRYQLKMYPSPTFKANVPLLINVPGRSSIEMHYGNWVLDPNTHRWDSEGCIEVGLVRNGSDEILSTVVACEQYLWPAIQKTEDVNEETWLTILDVVKT